MATEPPEFEPFSPVPPTPASVWAPGQDIIVEVPGPQGPVGPPPNLTIGEVTSSIVPTATITGTSPDYTLNLGLPQGNPGSTGAPGSASSLAIGTVTTLASGASATASITGSPPSQSLNLGIPQGPAGAAIPGPPGSTIYHGNGAPSNAVGVQGDNYIDDTGRNWWGPKGVSSWPATPAFSLVAATALPKRAFLTRTANQAVGAWPAKIQWQAVTELNVSGIWSAGQPTRIVVPAGVSYASIVCQVEVNGGASAGTLTVENYKNGVQLSPRSFNNSGRNTTSGSAVNILTEATYEVPVTAGDYFEVEVNQQSLTATDIVGSTLWAQIRFS